MVVAKETIELAFLAAIQHLPPRPRAVLILRDVLGWSASETAEALDGTVAAVNSALQRARARLQDLGRPDVDAWAPVGPPSDEERALLQRYMDAHARADAAAVIELFGDDVRFTMPTSSTAVGADRFDGRDAVAVFFDELFGPDNPGEWRLVPTRANGQPAAANYLRRWDDIHLPGRHVRRAARRAWRGRRDHDLRRLRVRRVRAPVDAVTDLAADDRRLSLLGMPRLAGV